MSGLKKAPKKKSKSVLKRERQNLKRRMRNKAVKSRMKTFMKKFRELLEKKEIEEAKKMVPVIQKEIDATVRKGVIHWKTGARYKSRLMGALSKIIKKSTQASVN